MILIVCYDLHNPVRDYDAVAKVLKSADSYCHPQGSVWLLDTQDKPGDWRDQLLAAGDPNDEFFVIRLSHNWASQNMDKAATTWLKGPRRTW
jgi:hypothetical protein